MPNQSFTEPQFTNEHSESNTATMSSTTLIRFAKTTDTRRDQPIYRASTSLRSSTVTFPPAQPSRIEKRRQRTRTFAEDPFRSRFGRRLPKAMREEARGMDWKTFRRTYSPNDIRVEQLRSTRRSAGRRHFEIGITGLRADGLGTRVSITAMGAQSAMSEVLSDHGLAVEILEFHQFEIFEATVTFIYTMHNSKRSWAVGFGADRDTSIASALCSAATLLHR